MLVSYQSIINFIPNTNQMNMVFDLAVDLSFIFYAFLLKEINFYNQIFEINENSLQTTCQQLNMGTNSHHVYENFMKNHLLLNFLQFDIKKSTLLVIVVYLVLRMLIMRKYFEFLSKLINFEFFWNFRLLIFGPIFTIVTYISMNLIFKTVSQSFIDLLYSCLQKTSTQ